MNLRAVWGHEANDFTPWLAANIELLSKAIGVPMEVEETEVDVERFSADVVARNPSDDRISKYRRVLESPPASRANHPSEG